MKLEEISSKSNSLIERKYLSICLTVDGFFSENDGDTVDELCFYGVNRIIYCLIRKGVELGINPIDSTGIEKQLNIGINEDYALWCDINDIKVNYFPAYNKKILIEELNKLKKIRKSSEFLYQFLNELDENFEEFSAFENLQKNISCYGEKRNQEDFTMKQLTERAVDRWQNQKGVKIFHLDFPGLRDCVKPRAGNLIYVIAPPKTGKTWFILSMAIQFAYRAHKVLFISAEMYPDDLYTRLASYVTGKNLTMFDDDVMNAPKSSFREFGEKINFIMGLSITISRANGINLTQLTAKIRQAHKDGFEVVVIDYLQKVHTPSAKDVRVGTGQVSGMLADVSKETGMLVVCASQTGRESQKGGITETYHGKESSAIEADADIIMALTDTTKTDGFCDGNEMTIKISQRNKFSGKTKIPINFTTGRAIDSRTENYEPRYYNKEG